MEEFKENEQFCSGDCESCTGDCASCTGHTSNHVKPSKRSMLIFGILTAVCIAALIIVIKVLGLFI